MIRRYFGGYEHCFCCLRLWTICTYSRSFAGGRKSSCKISMREMKKCPNPRKVVLGGDEDRTLIWIKGQVDHTGTKYTLV